MHQKTTIGDEPLPGQTATNIVYYRLGTAAIPDATLPSLVKDIGCRIHLCRSWAAFMSMLITHTPADCPTLILLDEVAHNQMQVTPSELSSMLSTMGRCVDLTRNVPIGIVIEQLISPERVKELHNSDISGLVPSSATFGYENTLHAISTLLKTNSNWSKKAMDLVSKEKVKIVSSGVNLTARQKQVLSLVCNRGLSNKKIASVLKISESTVKVHMSAILKEYGVRNRTQLALAANSSLKA